MRVLDVQAAIGTAIVLLLSSGDAKPGHRLSHLGILEKRHSHKRLHASQRAEGNESILQKRTTCTFPTDAGLVAVTPGSPNAGWAMSPDQSCTAGTYCPYACPPGEVMAQWNPKATSYTYPLSMDGGLYCDSNGNINKPFPNKPYCVSGAGSVGVQNNAGKVVSFCQTVLPGGESMLIPTQVNSWAGLAVPDPSYWCSTAAHYYVNAPGIDTDNACIWGDGSKPLGNWSPYVAGANQDSSGNTFLKLGWNPKFTDTDATFPKTKPTFGIKVVCSGSGCNGTPCSIDPSTNGIGGVTSADQASGAGGANFCVVTIPKGVTANIVVFNTGSSSSGASDLLGDSAAKASSSSETPTPTPTPSPTPTPTPTPTPQPTTSSTTSTTSSTSSPESSSSSSVTSSSSFSETSSSSSSMNKTSAYPTADNSPHVLFEEKNATTTSTSGTASSGSGTGTALSGTTAVESPIASATKKSGAPETIVTSSSLFSLVVMFAFAGYML